jgi:alpha-tubulin suppressor-like RCC1 family protein
MGRGSGFAFLVVLAVGCGRVGFVPVPFDGQKRMALGYAHTCIVRGEGDVICWGSGAVGCLGHGNVDDVGDDEPASSMGAVPLGAPALQIDSGAAHTCARIEGDAVRCWGEGMSGKLGYGNVENVGDNETAASAGDVEVGGPTIAVVAAGNHSCALLATGSVRCWGSGASGRLGYGSTTTIGDDELPSSAGDVPIGGIVVELEARGAESCVRLDSGAVRCWGSSSNGQLGYGNTATIGDDDTPADAGDIDLGGEAAEIAVGASHACARLTTGAVRCWGDGSEGRLGYGNTITIGDDEAPAAAGDVPLGGIAVQITAGAAHTCALLASGSVRCWGRGGSGQLGYGNTATIGDDETPASVGNVPLGGRAVDIAAGGDHTCARLESGAVRCWGSGDHGQLGYGNTENIGDDETPASAGDVPLE